MRYREKLNIVFIRDNGPRRSFQLRRSNFFLLVILFFCLPFLCLLLTIQCWLLWHENIQLRESMERAEADFQSLEARAESLENLEELLKEENVAGREIIIRQLAESATPAPEESSEENNETEAAKTPDTNEEFSSLDSGKVRVNNVQIRTMRGNALLISLDLRNPENVTLLSGEVEATLVLPDGERHELIFTPRESGAFRIPRFKRTVLTAQAPKSAILADGKVILEVREQGSRAPIFRSIYPVN